jgi:hypothetical protein
MNILQAIADQNLFAPFFKHHETWGSWAVFLAALFGLKIEDEALYAACTGSRPLPTRQAREAYLIVGRRGGKSFISALIAVFLAACRTYHLSPGEPGIVMLIAADRRQAKVLLRYVRAFLEGVTMLRQMIENVTAEGIWLTNGIVVEIHTASFRSIRGRTVVAAVCDEVAFWRNEGSANPEQPCASAQAVSVKKITDFWRRLCLARRAWGRERRDKVSQTAGEALGDDFDPAPSVPLRPFRRTCRLSGGRLRGRALLAFHPCSLWTMYY